MSSRWRHLLGEVGRFLAVGGVATVVAFVIFNLLVHGFSSDSMALLDHRPILAYVVANTIGMLISYSGSRRYAFRDRPPRHADGGRTAYFVINAGTMAIPIACLSVSRDLLGLDDPLSDNIAANVIGLVLGLAARFYLFRTFVFRRPIHLGELYDDPQLVIAAAPLPTPEGRHLPGGPVGGLSDRTRDPSTSGPAPPSAP